MNVIDRKPVPIYEVVCEECGSKIEYKASEMYWHHITCPVCGISNWANALCAVRYEPLKEENDDRSHPFADDVMMG